MKFGEHPDGVRNVLQHLGAQNRLERFIGHGYASSDATMSACLAPSWTDWGQSAITYSQ